MFFWQVKISFNERQKEKGKKKMYTRFSFDSQIPSIICIKEIAVTNSCSFNWMLHYMNMRNSLA